MPYFPAFYELEDKNIIICGGDGEAYLKLQRLLPYKPKLTVISPEISDEIKSEKGARVNIIERSITEADLDINPVFVVAGEKREENERIVTLCHKRNIPVNAVDMQDICDFIFPSLILKGDLSIGISTSGASPTAAIELKNRINSVIPENIDEILSWLYEIRPAVKEKTESRESFKKVLRELTKKAFDSDRTLTKAEVNEIIKEQK